MSGVRSLQRIVPSHLKQHQAELRDHFLPSSGYHRLADRDDDHARRVLPAALRRHQLLLFGYVLMPEHVDIMRCKPNTERPHHTVRVIKEQPSRQLCDSRMQFWQTHAKNFKIRNQRKFAEMLRYLGI